MKHLVKASVIGLLAAVAFQGIARASVFTNESDFFAATTGLTTENFESWPCFTLTPTPVTNLGVTWTSGGGIILWMPGRNSASSANDVSNYVDDQLTASLPAGITAAGGWVQAGFIPGVHGVQLTAYDAAEQVLDTVAITSSDNQWHFLGLTTSAAIAYVEFLGIDESPDQDTDFNLDDFHFGRQIPEPASVAVFSILLAMGLAAARRARRVH